MAVVTVGGESYHIDDKLKVKWDKIKDGKLTKTDNDRVYVVDGRERSGKSVFTLQQAAYIDPSIVNDLSRVTISPEETLNAIRNTQSTKTETKVIISDEAFRGMSSRAVLSKVNKMITQAFMEMGQKNLVLFIVLPSFFLLDMYAAIFRSSALFHIAKQKGSNARSFKIYSYKKKQLLYQIAKKKGWDYKMHTPFRGRFSGKYPGGSEFEARYRAKKLLALNNMGIIDKTQPAVNKIEVKSIEKLHRLLYGIKKKFNLSENGLSEWCKAVDFDLSPANAGIIQRKYGTLPDT